MAGGNHLAQRSDTPAQLPVSSAARVQTGNDSALPRVRTGVTGRVLSGRAEGLPGLAVLMLSSDLPHMPSLGEDLRPYGLPTPSPYLTRP